MSQAEVAKKLIGAWRYVGTRRDGKDYDRGASPKGMLYYGPYGEMAVQIAPDFERTQAGVEITVGGGLRRPEGLHRLFWHLHDRRAGWHRDASSLRWHPARRQGRSRAPL